LTENGIPFDRNLVFEHEMDLNSCLILSRELVKIPGITGLVVTADVMAAGIMSGLHQLGVRIPEDISVIGFDDISLCSMITPNLTTIHQDIQLKGTLAVDFMLQRLEGQVPDKAEIILPTHLVERQSVRSVTAG
jgi:LacI family transcriptional regulator